MTIVSGRLVFVSWKAAGSPMPTSHAGIEFFKGAAWLSILQLTLSPYPVGPRPGQYFDSVPLEVES